jgi:energy-converting hydrogenase B subunit D
MELLSAFFLCLIVICGIAALTVHDLLAAVIIFGAFSFFSATYFSVLGALDVAFTEAAVGAVISTVFFVTAIFRTARRPKI